MEGLSEEAPYLSEHRLHLNLYSYHNYSRNGDDGAARQTRRVLHNWYALCATRASTPFFFGATSSASVDTARYSAPRGYALPRQAYGMRWTIRSSL